MNTVEVKADQSEQDVSKLSDLRQDVTDLQENDNANESQSQEVGQEVARQLQHSKPACQWLQSRQGRAAFLRETIKT